MMQFDDAARTLTLSVRELLSSSDSLDLESQLIGQHRAVMGTEAHTAYLDAQVAASSGYAKEVAVSWTAQRRGWTVTVRGRVDGLRTTRDVTLIEEVKSTLLPGPLLPEITPELAHLEQVALYAAMLRASGRPIAGAQLVYVSIHDGAVHESAVEVSESTCRMLLETRIDDVLNAHLDELRRREMRRALAAGLRFPHARIRPGQDVMLDEVEGAARHGLYGLVSAPTGIGKTASAIFPMLRVALEADLRLHVVTAKVSQQALALETLRRLVPPASGACALQMAARDRICLNDDPECVSGKCPLLQDFERRLGESGLLERLAAQGVVDADSLTVQARSLGLCPHAVTLAMRRYATVLVGDFNHVFHPDFGAAGDLRIDAGERLPLLVVDEAHNLPDRVADHWSPDVIMPTVMELCRACQAAPATGDVPTRLYVDAGRLLERVLQQHEASLVALRQERGVPPPYTGEPDRQFFEALYAEVDVMLYRYVQHLAKGGSRPPAFRPRIWRDRRRPIDPLLAQLLELRHFCRCCELPAERFVAIWHDDARFQLRCLDPAPEIRGRLAAYRGAVLMSATLTPFDFYARQFGLGGADTLTLDLPSLFPRANRLLLIADQIDTTYDAREATAPAVADLMARVMAERPGNYLAFFPSFAYRDAVTNRLPPAAATVLRQTPAMDIRPLLARLASRPKSQTLLVAAVMGGVMAEGVDFAEDLAIGVFVVGPGLPPLGPERELVRGYFDAQHLDGFEHAYIGPGLTKVVQAAGRVIRTETDRGVIVLIGRRFVEPRYHDRLPGWWRDELIAAADPVPLVRAFWARHRAADTPQPPP